MQPLASTLSLFAIATLVAVPVRAQSTTSSLSAARQTPAAVTVDGLALFAGGRNGNTTSAVVDIYDAADDRWSAAALSVPRTAVAATAVDHLALFAGGNTSITAASAVVDVFDAQTWTWSTATLSQARTGLTATTLGTKAFFAGGGFISAGIPTASDVVDIYDSSLGLPADPAAWSTATLSLARTSLSSAAVGSQVLFAGGGSAVGSPSATVDIYDESTGLWTTAALSQARILGDRASAKAGTRAFFGGGMVAVNPMLPSDVVDVYDALTGLWSTETLSLARGAVAATALGNTVMFAGGWAAVSNPSDVVDVLNAGTGVSGPDMQLSLARAELGATTVGGKVLLAGGNVGGAATAQVDIFEPVGVNYCAALANSSGCAASISASGSSSLAANDLEVSAACVPNQPFLFFHAATQMQLPFGDGFRCAGVDLVRLPIGLASGNVAATSVDLPSAGITGPGARNFQCWFRDPAAGGSGFNTSDALEITFVP